MIEGYISLKRTGCLSFFIAFGCFNIVYIIKLVIEVSRGFVSCYFECWLAFWGFFACVYQRFRGVGALVCVLVCSRDEV